MNNLGYPESGFIDDRMGYTLKEIWDQPALWKMVYEKILYEKQSIISFLARTTSHEDLEIILTGAGTSAFIGLSLIGSFKRNLNKNTSAISTTDLITHPMDYLSSDVPVLLISFARSGNSPESIAAVRIADYICSNIYHLIITCDAAGALANYKSESSKFLFVLPSESNDKGLAMTGSYSGMLLSGLLIARIYEIETLLHQVNVLSQYGQKLLDHSELFKQLAVMPYERVVFLGSGPLYGTATESQLKVQELTDGKIICKNDSFLGFRHGPKAVINQKTLVFLLLSNEPYVNLYETDLINSLHDGEKPLYIAGLVEYGYSNQQLDLLFELSDNGNNIDEEFLPVCCILPAQMIGLFKSIQLGLNPDMPSISGTISRVVKGVTIYPFKNQD